MLCPKSQLKDEADRKISPSFIFVRGSEPAQQFLKKWWDAANSSHTTEDGMVLNKLMRDPEVTTTLNIQLFPEVHNLFPVQAAHLSGCLLMVMSSPAPMLMPVLCAGKLFLQSRRAGLFCN